MSLELSVIIPTHNPRRDYLARTLEALKRQTLAPEKWEVLIVDNKSEEPVSDLLGLGLGLRLRLGKAESEKRKAEKTSSTLNVGVMREERLGLTHARVRGFQGA